DPDGFATGRWQPRFDTLAIVNGGIDFAGTAGLGIDSTGLTSDFIPGWSNHDGTGWGAAVAKAGDTALFLTPRTPSRTHNRLYVPAHASAISFTIQRSSADPDDVLVVKLGNEPLARFGSDDDDGVPLDDTDVRRVRHLVTVPEHLRDSVATLSFAIERASESGTIAAEVYVDDVGFLDEQAAAAAHAALPRARPLSLAQLRDALVPHVTADRIENVTVVTHGFQTGAELGDSLMSLARAVADRFGPDTWLIDYDVVAGEDGNGIFGSLFERGQGMVDGGQSRLDSPEPRNIVFLWDWAPESNDPSAGWTGASADALFATMVDLGLVSRKHLRLPSDPQPAESLGDYPITHHFIAHSFGCAVTSETVRRLAAYGVPVDHVTYLDPHDFDQTPFTDSKQSQWDLGQPAGYGAAVWDNVAFVDVYYQTTREWQIPIFDVPVIPQGRPIPGAFNTWLRPELLGGGNGLFGGGDHSDVWQRFYLETIVNPHAIDGYAYSKVAAVANGAVDGLEAIRPEPVFFGADQDHTYSDRRYVSPEGVPNQAGLRDLLGLRSGPIDALIEAFEQKTYPADFQPLAIYNGTFSYKGTRGISGDLGTLTSDYVPGWNNHGGGGWGGVKRGTGNPSLSLTPGISSRTHNRLYVPNSAAALSFNLQRVEANPGDVLVVRFGGAALPLYTTDDSRAPTVAGEIRLDLVDAVKRRQLLDVRTYTNRVDTLSFSIERREGRGEVEAEVLIDDVEFLNRADADRALSNAGLPDSWGYVFKGDVFTLSSDTPFLALDMPVPNTAAHFEYAIQRRARSLNDELVVLLEGEEIDRVSLDAVDAVATIRRARVPEEYRGLPDVSRLTFRIEQPGGFNFFIEGVVDASELRFTSDIGYTGDLIPLDLPTLIDWPFGTATYEIKNIFIRDPSLAGGEDLPLTVRRAEAIDERGNRRTLRSDWELTYTDSSGRERLAGYVIFSDRIEDAKTPFPQTGRAWFAPATGAYVRITDRSPKTGRAAYFEKLPGGAIAGDRDPGLQGFQGRLRFEVEVASTTSSTKWEQKVWVDVTAGHSNLGPEALAPDLIARRNVLEIARLQQRLNYLDGALLGEAIVGAETEGGRRIVSDDGHRSTAIDDPVTKKPKLERLAAGVPGRPLVVDGIKEVLTNSALLRFRQSYETGSVAGWDRISSAEETTYTESQLDDLPTPEQPRSSFPVTDDDVRWLRRMDILREPDRRLLAEGLRELPQALDISALENFSVSIPFINVSNVTDLSTLTSLIDADLGLGQDLFEPLARYLLADATPTTAELNAAVANAGRPGLERTTFELRSIGIDLDQDPGRNVFEISFTRTEKKQAFFDLGSGVSLRGLTVSGETGLELYVTTYADIRFGIDLTKTDVGNAFFVEFVTPTDADGAPLVVAPIDLAGDVLKDKGGNDLGGLARTGGLEVRVNLAADIPSLKFAGGFISNITVGDPTLLVRDLQAGVTLPRTTLADLQMSGLAAYGTTDAGGLVRFTASLGATVLGVPVQGDLAIGDADIFDEQPPTVIVPFICGMGRILELDGVDIAAAFSSVGSMLASLRQGGLFDDAIPLVEGTQVRDVVRFDKAWEENVSAVFRPSSTAPAPSTLDEMLARLEGLLGQGGITAKYVRDGGRCELLLHFDLERALDVVDKKLALCADVGTLASLSSSGSVRVIADVGLKFTLGVDLAGLIGRPTEITDATLLADLNDKTGVDTGKTAAGDVRITLSTGSTFDLDLDRLTTVGDLRAAVARLDPRLSLEIEPRTQVAVELKDGRMLWLTVDDTLSDDEAYARVISGLAAIDDNFRTPESAEAQIERVVQVRSSLVLRERNPSPSGRLAVVSIGGTAAESLGLAGVVTQPEADGEWTGQYVLRGSDLDSGGLTDNVFLLAPEASHVSDAYPPAGIPAVKPTLAGSVRVEATDIAAAARLGLVDVSIEKGVVTGLLTTTLTLNDPGTDDERNGRITLSELGDAFTRVNRVSQIGTLIAADAGAIATPNTPDNSRAGSFDIQAAYTVKLPIKADLAGLAAIDAPAGVSIAWSGRPTIDWDAAAASPTIDWATWWGDKGTGGPTIVYDPALQQLEKFRGLSGASLIDAVKAVLAVLEKAGQDVPFFREKIPGLNRSLNDIVAAGGQFTRLVETLERNPAAGLRAFETAINSALAGAGVTGRASLGIVGSSLTITLPLQFAKQVVRGQKLDFDLQQRLEGAVGKDLGRLVEVSGRAAVSFESVAVVNAVVGIDCADPSSPRVYVETGTTSFSYEVRVANEDKDGNVAPIEFTASVLTFGVKIANGSLVFNRDGSGTGRDSAFVKATLTGGSGGRVYLDALATAGFSIEKQGKFELILPVTRADGSPLDDDPTTADSIEWSFDLGTLSGSAGSLFAATASKMPNFEALVSDIDFSSTLDVLADGWEGLFTLLQIAVDRNVFSAKLPLIGDRLGTNARFFADLLTK
ncbi:MAG: hypothetical protein ACKOEM_15365, partial [Planctomycetia bacterium]